MPLLDDYTTVRARTVALAAPLSAEDQMVQSMPEASPTKWHLAHTTWFFETFVLRPSVAGYPAAASRPLVPPEPARFRRFEAGLVSVGHAGQGFAFDNEGPRHRHFLEAVAIAERPVTSGEYLAFMRDGGYTRPELWLSDGWQR